MLFVRGREMLLRQCCVHLRDTTDTVPVCAPAETRFILLTCLSVNYSPIESAEKIYQSFQSVAQGYSVKERERAEGCIRECKKN